MSKSSALIIGNSIFKDEHIRPLTKPKTDAQKLAEILLDPSIGCFDEVLKLIDADASTIRENIEKLFHKRNKDDLLLLYYSGHGLMDTRGRLYLACQNTDRDLLRGTAITSTFIRDIMDDSRSQRKILILDCCHSGAIGNIKGNKAVTHKSFEGSGYGKVILTATDEIQFALEDDGTSSQLNNSVFTHFILQGLSTGDADRNRDGLITINELYEYVHDAVLSNGYKQTPQKWSYHSHGDLVIARNINFQGAPVADVGQIEQGWSADTTITGFSDNICKPLPGLLDRYDVVVDDLIKTFADLPHESKKALQHLYMEKIRALCQADIVYYTVKKKNQFVILSEAHSPSTNGKIDAAQLQHYIEIYQPVTLQLSNPFRFKINAKHLSLENDNCIILPTFENSAHVIVYGINEKSSEFEEVLSLMITSLCKLTHDFTLTIDYNKLMLGIYDEIKVIYSHASNLMYEKRFKAFCKALQNVTQYFEPIFYFDQHSYLIQINGWESLARDKSTGAAPVDLFKAAELWGVRFQTELDLYCMEKTLKLYNEKCNQQRLLPQDSKYLSINVYPDTILRTAYRRKIESLLQEERLITGKRLVFEISEKTLIPGAKVSDDRYLNEFEKVIQHFRRKFKISFSIDDFGVGYSSISRLNRLLPTYVKIDREILQFDRNFGREVIKYVNELSLKIGGSGFGIVIEGLDEHSKISPRELVNDLGVEYIQGHCLGIPKPDIQLTLDKEQFKDISKLLQWECQDYF